MDIYKALRYQIFYLNVPCYKALFVNAVIPFFFSDLVAAGGSPIHHPHLEDIKVYRKMG